MCSGKRQWWAEGYPTTNEEESLLNNEDGTENERTNENETDEAEKSEGKKLPKKNVEPITNN